MIAYARHLFPIARSQTGITITDRQSDCPWRIGSTPVDLARCANIEFDLEIWAVI